MDEERRKAYQESLAGRIRELEARLDELAVRARRTEAELRLQLQDEESDLRKRIAGARARLRALREASGDGWEEIRSGVDKLWHDLRSAWEQTSRKAPPPGDATHDATHDAAHGPPEDAPDDPAGEAPDDTDDPPPPRPPPPS